MSEVELILLNEGSHCTLYSIQFTSEDNSEYERFYAKFIENAKLNHDLLRIVQIVDKIADKGALERFFRPEGKMKDSVVATSSSVLKITSVLLTTVEWHTYSRKRRSKKLPDIRRRRFSARLHAQSTKI